MADSSLRLGIVGLGAMGGRIAGHLLAAGYRDVTGYDPDAVAGAELAALGLTRAASPTDLLTHADLVITSLPNEAALEQFVAGITAAGRPGMLVAETSTFSPAAKIQARDTLLELGIQMVDATISGTAGQLTERDVVVYVSGSPEAVAKVEPVLGCFARNCYDVGGFGNGSRLKLVSNLLVTIHTLAAAEAITLAEAMGLDPELGWRALIDGAGTSRMLEVRGPMMVRRQYVPPNARLLDYLKDIDLIAESAFAAGQRTPLFDCAAEVYREAEVAGLGELDHAAVAELLRAAQSDA